MQLLSGNTLLSKLNKPEMSQIKGLTVSKLCLYLSVAGRTIQTWKGRSYQRRALAQLNTYQLKDIGVSTEDALIEASKPFWRS
mgnify:CR=1 FL=1